MDYKKFLRNTYDRNVQTSKAYRIQFLPFYRFSLAKQINTLLYSPCDARLESACFRNLALIHSASVRKQNDFVGTLFPRSGDVMHPLLWEAGSGYNVCGVIPGRSGGLESLHIETPTAPAYQLGVAT